MSSSISSVDPRDGFYVELPYERISDIYNGMDPDLSRWIDEHCSPVEVRMKMRPVELATNSIVWMARIFFLHESEAVMFKLRWG